MNTIDKTLDHSLRLIAENASAMERHRAAAESILESVKKQIIGRRVQHGHRNLKGDYEITAIHLSWDGKIDASGLKVTSSGKLGNQSWDLGTIDARRLGL